MPWLLYRYVKALRPNECRNFIKLVVLKLDWSVRNFMSLEIRIC